MEYWKGFLTADERAPVSMLWRPVRQIRRSIAAILPKPLFWPCGVLQLPGRRQASGRPTPGLPKPVRIFLLAGIATERSTHTRQGASRARGEGGIAAAPLPGCPQASRTGPERSVGLPSTSRHKAQRWPVHAAVPENSDQFLFSTNSIPSLPCSIHGSRPIDDWTPHGATVSAEATVRNREVSTSIDRSTGRVNKHHFREVINVSFFCSIRLLPVGRLGRLGGWLPETRWNELCG